MRAFRFLVACAVAGCQTPPPPKTGEVPQNFVQVSPGVWRSAQPTNPDEWKYVKSQGVRHVVKLNFDSEGSDADAIAAGLDVHVLSIQPEGDKDLFDNIKNTFVGPDVAKLIEAENIIAAGGGVLVHCTHGQDRTGLVIGLHRVMHEHESKAEAYDEMLRYNFHPELHGLHEFWEDFTGALPR
jgi:protein tyrosine/serine phosphatase